jgi:hypothetical protein
LEHRATRFADFLEEFESGVDFVDGRVFWEEGAETSSIFYALRASLGNI